MTPALPLTTLELLAPARDADAGIAAIDHGADAVYIGGPAFGARAAAGNSWDDIARLCDYAHRFRAKVFLALNTLFTNEELPLARRAAFDAAAAGADVLIVQDMGLLMGPLPEIELHASTQCDIRTPEKAAFLETCGFTQIVLARELSLKEIAAVRAALKRARIEFFVHGALCVSYSGQCWMSQATTGRSANRGACSQPCRLPYDVFTMTGEPLAKKSHVLSLRDNDQSAHLEALIDAGVSSFKIEGRLKDLAYVKDVTAYYRRKLDQILARRPELARASDGVSTLSFEPDPQKVFSRGATDYFLEGKRFDLPYDKAQLTSPKSTGTPAAEVLRLETKRLIVRALPGVALANGDGLAYRAADEEIHGLAVNRAEKIEKSDASGRPGDRRRAAAEGKSGKSRNRDQKKESREGDLYALYPSEPVSKLERLEGLAPGLLLTRNRDHAFLKALAGKTAVRRIPVRIAVSAEGRTLSASISDGRVQASASIEAPEPFAPAADTEKNCATVVKNFSKLGGTPFDAEAVELPAGFSDFVPASLANELRRALAEKLLAAREADRPKPERAQGDAAAPYPEKILTWRSNVANAAAKAFYEAHGARVLEPAFEIKPVQGAALMTCRHCVRAALSLCPKMLRFRPELLEQHDRSLFRPEPLRLVNSAGEAFIAQFHCKCDPCEMTIERAPGGKPARLKQAAKPDAAPRAARAHAKRRRADR